MDAYRRIAEPAIKSYARARKYGQPEISWSDGLTITFAGAPSYHLPLETLETKFNAGKRPFYKMLYASVDAAVS